MNQPTVIDQELEFYLNNIDKGNEEFDLNQADELLDKLMDRYSLTSDNTDGMFDATLRAIYNAQAAANATLYPEEPKVPKEFEITVCRTSYGHRTFKIKALTFDAACEIAIDKAGDYEFSESSSEYSVD